MLGAIIFYWYVSRKLYEKAFFVNASEKTIETYLLFERAFMVVWIALACLGIVRGVYLLVA